MAMSKFPISIISGRRKVTHKIDDLYPMSQSPLEQLSNCTSETLEEFVGEEMIVSLMSAGCEQDNVGVFFPEVFKESVPDEFDSELTYLLFFPLALVL